MITIKPKLDKMNPINISPLDLVNIKDILGCFYYVLSNKIKVTIDRLERSYSVRSSINDIDCNTCEIKLKTEEGVYFKEGERVKVSFVINSMRYSFTSAISSSREEREVTLKIPVVIHHDEHRILPRVNLPEKISNCLELVTGFFRGVRIKGKVADISLGGLGFTPNNVENLRNSNEVDLKDTKIKTGDRFRKLKFEIDEDTLSIPVEICHTPDDERNTFGIKFDLRKKSKNNEKLKELIQSCVPQIRVINFASFYDKFKRDS